MVEIREVDVGLYRLRINLDGLLQMLLGLRKAAQADFNQRHIHVSVGVVRGQLRNFREGGKSRVGFLFGDQRGAEELIGAYILGILTNHEVRFLFGLLVPASRALKIACGKIDTPPIQPGVQTVWVQFDGLFESSISSSPV